MKPSFYDFKIYRVRKNWDDIGSGAGSFFVLENAIRVAKETGCNVYNHKKQCVWRYESETK